MTKLRSYDFYGHRRTWFILSAVLILAGLVSLIMPNFGLKLGIDFVGGSVLEARFARADLSTSLIRETIAPLGFGESIIQQAADDSQLFVIRTKAFSDADRTKLQEALRSGIGEYDVVRFEGIAGVIGAELTRKALLAVTAASLLMLVYITFRFEFRFGVAAVAALVHDVLITVGAFSLLGREVNSSFIAAILTVVGYSINDTIVVFDRIRENLRARAYGPGDFGPLVNRSVHETLSRTINTSLTTLLAIGAVFLFGGKTTRDFALALIIGITTGTYSSIFIASPIWAMWRERSFAAVAGRSGEAGDATRPELTVTVSPAEPTAAGTARNGAAGRRPTTAQPVAVNGTARSGRRKRRRS